MHHPTRFHYSIDIFPMVKYFFNTENDVPFICHRTNISVISSYWPTNKPENHLVINKLYSRKVCDSTCSLFWQVLKRNERNNLVVPLLVPQNWHKLSKFYIRVDNNGATRLCTDISYYSSQSKLNFCCIIQNDSQFLSDKRDRHSVVNILLMGACNIFNNIFLCLEYETNTATHIFWLHKRNKWS